MTNSLAVILFALAMGYFTSRILLRMPWFPPGERGLRWVHVISALVLIGGNFLLKFPFHGYNRSAALLIVLLQAIWFLLDHLRKRHPGMAVGN